VHNKRWPSICFLFVALISFVGCKSKPINPNQGFTVTTSIETQNSAGGPGPFAPMPGQQVLGTVVPGTGGVAQCRATKVSPHSERSSMVPNKRSTM